MKKLLQRIYIAKLVIRLLRKVRPVRRVSAPTDNGLLEKLWRRHHNPLSWALRPVFFVALLISQWKKAPWMALASLIGLATSWFWFPEPKKVPAFIQKSLKGERDWLQKPMDRQKGTDIALGSLLTFLQLKFARSHNLAGMLGSFLASLAWKGSFLQRVADRVKS
jgi:hypothetical protein